MSFRPTPTLFSTKPSSKHWLARQFKDPYVRQRLSSPKNYRSRSAFKLIEINEKHDKFLHRPDVRAVIDLGAAPGGWSQVAAAWIEGTSVVAESTLADDGRGVVIAVDRLRMLPIVGVHTLQMDFLSPDASSIIGSLLREKANEGGKADVILSDMAANTTGNRVTDVQNAMDISEAVWQFARSHLRTAESIGRRRGGVLLLKYFEHPELQTFRRLCLEPHFHNVLYVKPNSSRSESSEGYWLCVGYKGK
ncbi:23S ribosomal RNA methyltransferase [Artomyces pyxidatus]|uniref:23S ribosomal RNA methyltransferase n=1 Tax=Artomyces pyxidatus TaxID=48021 RepID=A0ACB8T9H2_9AGAM|nr:23S ribosomal RNA methyltransferase [Artomyces pyxidatus]